MMRLAMLLVAATIVATALDVALGALGGYPVRIEAGRLVTIDAALLALVVVPVGVGLALSCRLVGWPALARRSPLALVLLAGVGPVLVLRARKLLVGGPWLVLAGVLVAVVIVAVVHSQRRAPRGGSFGLASVFVVVALALAALLAAIRLPLRGSDLVRPPSLPPRAVASAEQPNLLLIVLDTVRADHLSLLGYGRRTSPWLERFAAQATVFRKAVAASSWTLPSHATLFTGLYSRAHGADFVESEGRARGASLADLGRLDDTAEVRPLSQEAITLAELAAAAGLETGAVCANSAYLYRYFGLDQGFGTYVDTEGVRPQQRLAGFALGLRLGLNRHWPFRRVIEGNERYYLLASEINRLALRWLTPRRDRRFFLFLNYMDAHEPYIPIGRYRSLYPAAAREPVIDGNAIRSRQREILPDERAPLVDAYDASLRFLDDHLAALFDQLAAWGLLDRTVVIIASDHGEAFGEHHDLGHSNGVYQTELHVPLLLRAPGQTKGATVDRPVHLVDVFPTALELLGLAVPPTVQGVSLYATPGQRRLPLVGFTGRQADLARQWPQFYDRTHSAVYDEDWKLIRRSDDTMELYDLARDPEERQDLAAQQGDVVRALARALDRFEAEVVPAYGRDTAGPPPAAAQDRLRALGYLQ